MICGDCGTRLPVDRTTGEAITVRVHTCACGSRWESTQKITSRLPSVVVRHATGSLRVRANSPPLAPANPPALIVGAGGKGGVLPSGFVQGPTPDPNCNPEVITRSDQTRARRKRNPVTVAPVEFVAFWALYPRHVAKEAAVQAWVSLGPSAELIQEITTALTWQRVDFLRREPRHVPHASTWLRHRRWEDDRPTVGQLNGVHLPARTQQNIESGHRFLERHGRTPE